MLEWQVLIFFRDFLIYIKNTGIKQAFFFKDSFSIREMVIETSEDNSYSSSQLLIIENETKREILLSGSSAIFHFSPFPQSIYFPSLISSFLSLFHSILFDLLFERFFFTNFSFNKNQLKLSCILILQLR